MKQKLQKFTSLATRFLLILLGAGMASVGLEIFLIPNKIIDGGITGISIMASHLSGLPLGLFLFVLNIPFFLIGYKQFGKTFAITTAVAVALLSTGVSVLHPIPGITQDIFLASVFGGMILGAGVGIVIRVGGSMDGTEIVAIILDKRTSFSVGEIVMFLNLFILGVSGFIFGWDRAMYSLVAYFIAYKAIDIIVEGLDESKAVMIISEHHEEISSAIQNRLGRSIAVLEGKVGEREQKVIHVVVSRLEIAKLRSIVHGFDEDALCTIGSVEVPGKKHGGKRAIH